MSATQNGFAICEGRRSFAIMPATIQCDRRHAIKDNRPLTKEQIEKMDGVTPARPRAPIPAKTVRHLTPEEHTGIIANYLPGDIIAPIAAAHGVHGSSIIFILQQAGVYVSSKAGRKAKGTK